jgi:hypothetical protein
MKPIRWLVALTILSATTFAADIGGRNGDGGQSPNADAKKSARGFGGLLVVTPDKNWEEKWNTPEETTPRFITSKRVRVGETLTILIFFNNAILSPQGGVQVLCDIQLVRPDKTISVDAKKVDCFTGPIQGDPVNVRLAKPRLGFKGESSDVLGAYTVHVTLYDNIASIAVPLEATFTLER